jgi:hypothetical protein
MSAFAVTIPVLTLSLCLAGTAPDAPLPGAAGPGPDAPPALSSPQLTFHPKPLLAAGEVAGLNLGVWAFLHYAGDAFYSYISWETIRDNIRDGWEWDRSRYFVNFYHHPYHGYLYYNAGRANGLGFWGSSAAALGGSLMWEVMMEKYRPSINDLVTTTAGGIVYGEAGYRFSALVRKRDARGLGRVWREVVGFVLDPVGGVNRLLNGREDAEPWLPGAPDLGRVLNGSLSVSGPLVARGGESMGPRTPPLVAFSLDYGDPAGTGWSGRPFDVFSVRGRLRCGPDAPHLSLAIHGALVGRPREGRGGSSHFVGLYQHYEYYGIDTMRVGGTSFTGGWAGRFSPSPEVGLTAAARLGWLGLGASDDFPVLTERRAYNLSTGVTGAADLAVSAKGYEYASLSWRHYDLFNLNVPGSRPGRERWDILIGQVSLPVWKRIGIGVTGEYCGRSYDLEGQEPGSRKVFEARVFATWQF